eukprot:c20481_g1_i2.p1 GENE.c20481_g1_i2~~c20481_g1_i2.p1  ORF type:complete len:100 (-),score=20.94 c20481_g1_i2:332-631(-)
MRWLVGVVIMTGAHSIVKQPPQQQKKKTTQHTETIPDNCCGQRKTFICCVFLFFLVLFCEVRVIGSGLRSCCALKTNKITLSLFVSITMAPPSHHSTKY